MSGTAAELTCAHCKEAFKEPLLLMQHVQSVHSVSVVEGTAVGKTEVEIPAPLVQYTYMFLRLASVFDQDPGNNNEEGLHINGHQQQQSPAGKVVPSFNQDCLKQANFSAEINPNSSLTDDKAFNKESSLLAILGTSNSSSAAEGFTSKTEIPISKNCG
ncbi:unnamed protein product [Notodromas monacha]|uniref:C2H2-type domain-containing protein n=1 Tax=Notodromas monacha TaxID=399045 RepID=A0A7R9C0T0_9CRUS|nr:unnamed protein product [Notodromas monacha]CAG0923686.1 unnamed protein product [Notodromas monacha]